MYRRLSPHRIGPKAKPRAYYAHQERRRVHSVGEVRLVFSTTKKDLKTATPDDVKILMTNDLRLSVRDVIELYSLRWQIENDGYRELKEGFGLEKQRWGRDAAAARCRTTLTILAFNTTQVYRSRGGSRLAKLGIRRLREQTQRQLGRSPAVVFMEDCYGVMSLEALLAAVGAGVRQGLLPTVRAAARETQPSGAATVAQPP